MTQCDDLPPLVSEQDPDWRLYREDDPEYFLRAAGELIRRFVGWHLWPSRTETVRLSVGARGVIMLPSRHVTAVEQVTLMHGEHPHTLLPDEYLWHEAGWIERRGQSYWNDGWFRGPYIFGSDPYYLPICGPGYSSVTFTHGYPDGLPADVKQIAFEVAEQAMAVRTGNVKMLEAPIGFRIQASQDFGLSLNELQIARLSNYRLGMVR
ncbi:hypothetical protein VT930_11910 [Mycobacterium sherrisii]|uniref:hypothetical protein n=1 Tax=Mycobacterium sherrisii TaxID=243061 RepID=UPI002DDCA0B4|nr:hypothetical protein [Mycobacterium sherrisii]MEC4763809.1 hypothetical protein [Mycobacterium sherrisii]